MNQWPPNGITGRPHRGLSAARATEGCHGSHGVGQLMELRTPPAELSKAKASKPEAKPTKLPAKPPTKPDAKSKSHKAKPEHDIKKIAKPAPAAQS